MKIYNREVNSKSKPLIVAEMSGNHNESLDRAIQILDKAAEIGLEAIKIQTYTPDTMTLNINNKNFEVNDSKSLWSGKNLYKLYSQAHTPYEWHQEIFKRAKEKNIICFSSPFDKSAVDLLESLNNPVYKVASFEITDIPLISYIAKTKKPVILSTGLATLDEIKLAVETLENNENNNYSILKCTSSYPASPADCNIVTIPEMKKIFNCEIGLSDHTLGIGVSLSAISQGASIIEKHFTLDRNEGGVDAAFSLNPAEMSQLLKESENVYLSLGKIKFGATKNEKKSLYMRRSIFIVKDIKHGECFDTENIKVLRPNLGIQPVHYFNLLGKKSNKDLKKGHPLNWDDVI